MGHETQQETVLSVLSPIPQKKHRFLSRASMALTVLSLVSIHISLVQSNYVNYCYSSVVGNAHQLLHCSILGKAPTNNAQDGK